MNIRPILLSALIAIPALLPVSSHAHDPQEFDRMVQAVESKTVPKTCHELSVRSYHAGDSSNLAIVALKKRCDAEKREAAKIQKSPTTCAHLTKRNAHASDASNRSIVALKRRCAAQSRLAAKRKAAAKQ